MVRLKPAGGVVGDELFVFPPVSIPQWFDWDLRLRGQKTRQKLFPFHNGSIETAIYNWEKCLSINISIPLWFDWDKSSTSTGWRYLLHFHSTMVRLRLSLSPPAPTRLYVLPSHHGSIEAGSVFIALWPLGKALFPFHYGSIETGRRSRFCLPLSGISIPLWFDWDEELDMLKNEPTWISIPLWFDWDPVFHFLLYETLNIFATIFILIFLSHHPFPSFLTICIATHSNSIKPELLASGFRFLLRFPFHYGSIETPLWGAGITLSTTYFHSTMVRLRRDKAHSERRIRT
jgi:hypothetical protein